MINRRFGSAAVAVAATMALAGCSGSSSPSAPASNAPTASGSASSSTTAGAPGTNGEQTKPAAQVLQDAKTALFNAPSVHVTGTTGGGGGSGTIDFRFVGNDAAGTQQISGLTVNVVKAGGKLYLKAPAGFWNRTAGPTAAPKLADKWIVVPAGQAGGAGDLTLQQLAASLNADDSPLVPQVSTGDVNGQPAVLVRQQNGATLAVANTGSPVPLQITPGAGKQGKLTFTDYGKVPPVTAPSGAVTPQQAAQSPTTASA